MPPLPPAAPAAPGVPAAPPAPIVTVTVAPRSAALYDSRMNDPPPPPAPPCATTAVARLAPAPPPPPAPHNLAMTTLGVNAVGLVQVLAPEAVKTCTSTRGEGET